jgi:hypothetical protein
MSCLGLRRASSIRSDTAQPTRPFLTLRVWAFKIWRLEGSRLIDAPTFHAEAARVFGFPSYYRKHWDAFNDWFGELELPRRLAIVWSAADRRAAADLKTFAEAVCMFHVHIDARSRAGIQLELFIEERPHDKPDPSAENRLNPPSPTWDFPKSFPTAEKAAANQGLSTSSTSWGSLVRAQYRP